MAKLLINSTVDGKKIATVDDLNAKVDIAQTNVPANQSKFVKTDATSKINTFSDLIASDIPNLAGTKITSGYINDARINTTIARTNQIPDISGKVDKVTGKELSTNDYTTDEKTKLSEIAIKANNYTHPAKHPASVITQDASNRFVSDAEKSTWNAKVESSRVLTDVPANAIFTDTKYTHPSTHPPSIIAQTSSARFVTDAEKTTWNGKVDASRVLTDVPAGAKFTDTDTITTINGKTGVIVKADIVALGIPAEASSYTHPSKHPASVITQDASNRFVTDTEKGYWNAKADTSALTGHTGNTSNPHSVTKAQVGLEFADNTTDANKPISTATQTALNTKAPTSHATSATTYGVGSTTNYGHVKVDSTLSTTSVNPVQNKAVKAELDTKALNTDLTSHATSKTNPHGVTKAQVGLGSVDNTSDTAKPISTATQNALNGKADITFVNGAIQSAIQDTWGGSY